jgi:hypothetical protein
MEQRRNSGALAGAALLLALGIGLAGGLVGKGFRDARKTDRYVTVKGLAEQVVKADVAIWTLQISSGGNDLAKVQAKIDADIATITKFLTDAGIEADAIRLQRLEVQDALAQAWRTAPVGEARFTISQTLIVRTEKVDLVANVSRRTGELVRSGVVLNDMGGPVYIFTRLNDIKPGMIAEATRKAREGAEQFAADSQSHIAGIRRATQGLFQILARDESPAVSEASQVEKKIRVVTTIEYLLED